MRCFWEKRRSWMFIDITRCVTSMKGAMTGWKSERRMSYDKVFASLLLHLVSVLWCAKDAFWKGEKRKVVPRALCVIRRDELTFNGFKDSMNDDGSTNLCFSSHSFNPIGKKHFFLKFAAPLTWHDDDMFESFHLSVHPWPFAMLTKSILVKK